MIEKILQTYLEDDTFKIDVDVIVKEYSANELSFLKWENQSKPQPTKAQLDEIVEQLSPNWKTNRENEYPTLKDCIHGLLDGGDTLSDLQEKRTATKNKYPKE
jgi:hypothetical protein